MSMLIDGKKVAEHIISKYKNLKSELKLVVILVGNNPASEVYVAHKKKKCDLWHPF